MVSYLNGVPILKKLQHGVCGFWGEVRKALDYSQKLIDRPVSWSHDAGTDNYIMMIGHPVAAQPIYPTAGNVHSILNALISRCFHKKWLSAPSQGRFAFCLSRSRLSNCANDSHLSFCDWRFLWKARLSLTPVNANNHTGMSKRCRKCGAETESLAHVLNHCRVHSAFWRKRHDGIQSLLVDQLKSKYPSAEISVDKTFPHANAHSGGNLRPDIVVDIKSEKTVFIIDTKSTIDTVSAWSQAEALTDDKYKPISDYYRGIGYGRVILSNFIISSLGSFCPKNWRLLGELGLLRSNIKYLVDKCRRHAIHWSRNIWLTHCGSQLITY
jgi:hypothetical protein